MIIAPLRYYATLDLRHITPPLDAAIIIDAPFFAAHDIDAAIAAGYAYLRDYCLFFELYSLYLRLVTAHLFRAPPVID